MEYTMKRRGGYLRHWVYLILSVGIVALWFIWNHQRSYGTLTIPGEAPIGDSTANWFFVLQFPTLSPDLGSGEAHRKITDWISSLRRAGYHPLLLSDVTQTLSSRQLLPEKTIVISIDEPLRANHSLYDPIFRQARIPAVYTASTIPLKDGDRGYLSQHALYQLPTTGLWNIVLTDPENPTKLMAPEQVVIHRPFRAQMAPWRTAQGLQLRNTVHDLNAPQRLYIPWSWSGADIVHRLQADTPAGPEGASLAIRTINQSAMGVLLARSTSTATEFSWSSPAGQRGADVLWYGTRGLNDLQLDFSVGNTVGEYAWAFRVDPRTGRSIRVRIIGFQLLIEEQIDGKTHRLGEATWNAVPPWNARISLTGSYLTVWQNSEKKFGTSRVSISGDANSVIQLLVYDQMFGAAQVQNIQAQIYPLTATHSN